MDGCYIWLMVLKRQEMMFKYFDYETEDWKALILFIQIAQR